ncbi:hypothetical protein HN873_028656 [Arachis hypogaea]
MEEFMVDGQRSNCGQFKPGTFEKLALKMLEAFSGCTLTAKHCKNKHKRLKEKYHKDVLDAWLKAHPTKFYSPGKPFPLFHWLEGIFGRDRATGGAAVSGFNAEEQVNEETEDTTIGFDDSEMSPQQELDGDPAMQGQASHFEAGASAGSTRKNAQLIADAIVGVNKKFKVGEKLTQLGFGDDKVVRAILKFVESPNVYAHFLGLTNSQMIGLVRFII